MLATLQILLLTGHGPRMADLRTAIVPLNRKTWKVQCHMALVKDSLWGIVSGTESAPGEDTTAERRRKYSERGDRALAIIVLAVDPTLFYLLGDLVNPREVWTKLEEQFQRKTWANKLHLRWRLFSPKLKEGGSVNEHIKMMTEIFEALVVIGDAVSEEARVVHLLASLPESFNMLVQALEAQSESVPKWEVVIKGLLHEELKIQEKVTTNIKSDDLKALAANGATDLKKPQKRLSLPQARSHQKGVREVPCIKKSTSKVSGS